MIAAEEEAEEADDRKDADAEDEEPTPPTPLPVQGPAPHDRYPIDLASALRLAGANNLQIALAAEQIREAVAELEQAKLLWVPSVDVGLGYNRHDGQIQDTRGEVIDVSRQSGFIGGGPRIGGAPLNGLTGGPPRLFLGLNPAEACFNRLVERQETRAAEADLATTFNDTLRDVGLQYYDLVDAQTRATIAREAVANFERLLELTEEFVEAGTALPADAGRVRAQLENSRAEMLAAQRDERVASARLARLLRLDPAVTLFPHQPMPVPVTLVPLEIPVGELIAQGLGTRPELARHQFQIAAAQARLCREKWRPWVPNLYLATSAGGFGGGPNGHFGDFEGRNDFDALAVWSFQNLGLGNHARQREEGSRHRQEILEFQRMYDRVAAEVVEAYHRAGVSAAQLEVARAQVNAAAEALPLNFRSIIGGELRPIEAQQAISQLAQARRQYLQAVIEYDRGQLQLLRAIGNPPDDAAIDCAVSELPEADWQHSEANPTETAPAPAPAPDPASDPGEEMIFRLRAPDRGDTRP